MLKRSPSMTGRVGAVRAFTLIELMVVILIIGILLAILLPAIKGARALGYQVKEMAAGQQKMVAWTTYATDNKDACFTGYIPWAAGHLGNTVGPYVWLHPDPWYPSHAVEGNVIKMNGLRFMGATGLTLDALMVHKPTANLFRNRPTTPTFGGSRPPTTLYDSDVGSLPAAMAFHPSLGMNTTFVGGNWHRGAMQGYSAMGGPGHPRPKKWYVTETREILRTDMLMIFCSSRGVDIKTTGSFGSTSWGRNPAAWTPTSQVVPGYWEVVSPRVGFPQNAPTPMGPWIASNTFDETKNPKDWGFVHPRHNSRAVTAMADGHVEMQSLSQLRDMRKWSNYAPRADWNFTPNP